MFRIGMSELIVIFLIVLLLFGSKRLPEIGKALAKTIKDFRKETKNIDNDAEEKQGD